MVYKNTKKIKIKNDKIDLPTNDPHHRSNIIKTAVIITMIIIITVPNNLFLVIIITIICLNCFKFLILNSIIDNNNNNYEIHFYKNITIFIIENSRVLNYVLLIIYIYYNIIKY